jgi:hypothetical protein
MRSIDHDGDFRRSFALAAWGCSHQQLQSFQRYGAAAGCARCHGWSASRAGTSAEATSLSRNECLAPNSACRHLYNGLAAAWTAATTTRRPCRRMSTGGSDLHGAEQRLERVGALVAQPPWRHAVGADAGTGDKLADLALHDALLQLSQRRLAFGKAEAHAVGAETAGRATKGGDLEDRHLARAGDRLTTSPGFFHSRHGTRVNLETAVAGDNLDQRLVLVELFEPNGITFLELLRRSGNRSGGRANASFALFAHPCNCRI